MPLFVIVSLGVVAAGFFGLFARLLKQPMLVGYLFAGLFLSFLGVFTSSYSFSLEVMAQLGVTLLLFLVGLEMSLKEIRLIGKTALVSGLGQIIFTSFFGFIIARALGFAHIPALYIAVALTFSSTIIVVKLLSEKKDLASLYGKISIGFLLVQDLVAIFILIFLSGFKESDLTLGILVQVLTKGILLLGALYLLSRFVLAKIFDRAATTPELLFILSLAWVLLVASVVSLPVVGFSIEIGGFLAGLALSGTAERLQIASRVRPLRDFFITIFFLLLGAKLLVGITPEIAILALIFSLFVLLGNPLIVLAILGVMGYKKRTSFLASVTVAQISEFSLIVVALGQKVGHLTDSVVGLITLVAIITMTLSTYLILYGHKIYSKIEGLLSFFERSKVRENALVIDRKFTRHIVLLGCDRTGKRLLSTLARAQEPVVIVDFNPTIVEGLVAEGYTAFYGDISDVETLEALALEDARLVISTTGSLEDNLVLLETIAKLREKPIVIFTATNSQEALDLYEHGADYVLVPHTVTGDHLAHLLSAHGISKEYLAKLKSRHFDRLARDRF